MTAVLVLYGLPSDLTSSILAHEAMHVWLRLHGSSSTIQKLQPKIEEGLCQVVSHMYLTYVSTQKEPFCVNDTMSTQRTIPNRPSREKPGGKSQNMSRGHALNSQNPNRLQQLEKMRDYYRFQV